MKNNLLEQVQILSKLTDYLNTCTSEQLKEIKQKCIESIITDNKTFEKEIEEYEKEKNLLKI